MSRGHGIAAAVSAFGAATKRKFANRAIAGAPEDQLRSPLETLIADVAQLAGLPRDAVTAIPETTLSHLSTRPDFAVTLRNALIGFMEAKAPGKGADPRRFTDEHDKKQWVKLKTLPNLVYTDGNSFGLWRDGQLVGSIVHLEGDVETSGSALSAPSELLALFSDFLSWHPIQPKSESSWLRSPRACAVCYERRWRSSWSGTIRVSRLWRRSGAACCSPTPATSSSPTAMPRL